MVLSVYLDLSIESTINYGAHCKWINHVRSEDEQNKYLSTKYFENSSNNIGEEIQLYNEQKIGSGK